MEPRSVSTVLSDRGESGSRNYSLDGCNHPGWWLPTLVQVSYFSRVILLLATWLPAVVVAARGEKTIVYSLSAHIGELVRFQAVEQDLPKAFHLTVE